MEGRNFNTAALATNITEVEALARRMRQKEEVGTDNDELILCRTTSDLKFLIEVVESQQNANAILQTKMAEVVATTTQELSPSGQQGV